MHPNGTTETWTADSGRSSRRLLSGSLIPLFGSACLSTFAEGMPAGASDKSSYHLLKPTPRALMRGMKTDRPDRTESPYTVDAGHFQIEMDVLNYAYDRMGERGSHARTESLAIAPFNLKAGLWNDADLHLALEPYRSVRISDRDAGKVTQRRGSGDLVSRVKINLWGNDGGSTAFAVMPFLKLPTNQDHLGNRDFEGGVILPFAVELPAEIAMGAMTGLEFLRDTSSGGYHPEFVNSITFSRTLVGGLAGYIEFFSTVSGESNSGWVGTFDFGLTCSLTEDIQLDAGLNAGLTRPAEDWNPFLGISWRY